jgi:hypothetical protein
MIDWGASGVGSPFARRSLSTKKWCDHAASRASSEIRFSKAARSAW